MGTPVKDQETPTPRKEGVRLVTALTYAVAALAAAWLARPAVPITVATGIGLEFFAVFQIVLMSLSVPATAFSPGARGFVSFDRLPLVAAVLLFGAAPAAWAAGGAAFAWTIVADPRREALQERAIRALANGGMFLLATLAGGLVYRALGGPIPLQTLSGEDLGRAFALILTLQAVNEVLFLSLTWPVMTGAERRHPVNWPTTLTEVVIALTGVITALVFMAISTLGFALYTTFVVGVAMLFRRVIRTAETERRRAEELAAVNRVNQAVSSAIDIDDLIEAIFREVRGLMNFAAFIIGIYDREANELDIRLNYDEGIRHPPTRRKSGEGLLAWTMEHRASLFVEDARKSAHPSIRHSVIVGRPPISIIAIPINFENVTIGVISVQDYHPHAFELRHLRLLEGFATQIGVAITNTRLFAELRTHQQELESRVTSRTAELEQTTSSLKDAINQKEALLSRLEKENRRDPLTGLANRRHLDETLHQELYRADRFRHELSVTMCDLDHFKDVNDKLGHALGDEVLKTIANILRTELRATDFAARYGGEEFVIIFPETGRTDVLSACEKLRTLIEHHPWERLSPELAVTMSFGVARFSDARQTAAQMLASADRALYQAKRSGRNRVCESALAADGAPATDEAEDRGRR